MKKETEKLTTDTLKNNFWEIPPLTEEWKANIKYTSLENIPPINKIKVEKKQDINHDTIIETIKKTQERVFKQHKVTSTLKSKAPANYNNAIYGSFDPVYAMPKAVDKKNINKEEEVVINYIELADFLAEKELKEKYSNYKEIEHINEYTELLEKYKNIIINYEKK